MTAKQDALYWRMWGSVQRWCKAHEKPVPDRHDLHRQALGCDKSHKVFSNADFDHVLGVFRAISEPAEVDPQLRQLDQPRSRKMGKLRETLACLGLYIQDPAGYAREIIRDKVNGGSWRHVTDIDDLSDQRPHPDRPSQLEQLIMTLDRALNGRDGYRSQAGDSVHDMRTRAGLKCWCRRCTLAAAATEAHTAQADIIRRNKAIAAMEETLRCAALSADARRLLEITIRVTACEITLEEGVEELKGAQ